jgi:hypothetical protein
MSKQTAKPVVLKINEWDTSAHKYMQPRINERGGKSITLISKQTNRSLHISTPLMMTWGVSDFLDEKTGESDGKYSISLNFPNEDFKTEQTTEFLDKLKSFENQILEDAVKNSELWWGEEMTKEICKHTFFSFIKYSKSKETKKIDHTKPPSIRAKVPFWDNKWVVEIYDTKLNMIFPSKENPSLTPTDFVPKLSSVACVLQCGGIWIGGKGWGLTWKLIQCVVKLREIQSIYGTCQIHLSSEERDSIDNQNIKEDVDIEETVDATPIVEVKNVDVQQIPQKIPQIQSNVLVDDSDGEDETNNLNLITNEENVIDNKLKTDVNPPTTPLPVVVEQSIKSSSEESVAPKKKIVKRKP